MTSLFGAIGLEVVHEARLGVTHIVWRLGLRSLLRVIEPRCGGIRIRAEIIAIFSHGHETCIMLRTIAIETIWNARHRASSVRELASSICLRFVEGVSGTVGSGFATSRDCCQVAPIVRGAYAKLSIQRCEIIASIADEGLLSLVTNTCGMVSGRVELLVVDCILVLLSSTSREFTWVVTMGRDRVGGSTCLSLFPQFSLGNCLTYRTIVLVPSLLSIEELLSGLHHLLVVCCA